MAKGFEQLLPSLLLALCLSLIAPGLPYGPTPASAATSNISPVLLSQMAADPLKPLAIIVEMDHATPPFAPSASVQLAQQAVTLLATSGGRPIGALPLIDSAAGWANAAVIKTLSGLPGVAYIHADATVRPRPAPRGPAWPPGKVASLYPQEVNADRVWSLPGGQGSGVSVAILDSGVASDADLSTRLLAAVSFAGGRDPSRLDPGGHGTHVAGIVAGNGTRSAGQYVGVAPAAGIVDVRVLDANGNGRWSSVVRGIEWVLAHRAQYGIRVINLSFGAPAAPSYRADPLSAAVEIAWKRGLVVVAASGNGGPGSGTTESPGTDPYVVTVGATDDQATSSLRDDQLAWFSAWGTPTGGRAKPDLVGPGRRLVSIRVAGSTLDQQMPDHVVLARTGATYFRLTGSSQATAVVSGAAALALSRQPGLNPDQVKAMLVGTTQPYGPSGSPILPDPSADGAGLLDAYAGSISATRPNVNAGQQPADGLARTLYPLLYGQPLVWKDPAYLGRDWTGLTWSTLVWDAVAWSNLKWDDVGWDTLAWDDVGWDTTNWNNVAWDDVGWDSSSWDSLGFD